MTPLQFYKWMRKKYNYRPPFAAYATFAKFAEAEEEFWDHADNVSEYLKRWSPYDVAIFQEEGEQYTYLYSERVYGESICAECYHMRWLNPDEFVAECNMSALGIEWPGRTNEGGDIVACPQFRPDVNPPEEV